MKSWQPASLAKRPKCRNNSYFWIHEFRNKDQFKQSFVELILISEITNSEIRITSTLRYFARLTGCQDFISKNLWRNQLGLPHCLHSSVTGKHIPPRDIIPMGIDSLRNRSEFTPRYIFAWRFRSESIPMGINSEMYVFTVTPVCSRIYSAYQWLQQWIENINTTLWEVNSHVDYLIIRHHIWWLLKCQL